MRLSFFILYLFLSVPVWAEDPTTDTTATETANMPWGAIVFSIVVFIILVSGILVQKRWTE